MNMILMQRRARVKILKNVLEYLPLERHHTLHSWTYRDLLLFRLCSRDFCFVVDNHIFMSNYGLHNYSLRNENGETTREHLLTIRREAHIPNQIALKIINYRDIWFICNAMDLDYFAAGRRFKFVRYLNFRFPKERISLTRYCSSLGKLSKYGSQLKCLEEICFDLSRGEWIDRKLSFLKYCNNLRITTLTLQNIKYKYPLYDSRYREEPSHLLRFLEQNPRIRTIKFEMVIFHGRNWSSFFHKIPSSVTGLYMSLLDAQDLVAMMNAKKNQSIIYKNVNELPTYGLWSTLDCIQNSFHHIKRLTVDDDIFLQNGSSSFSRIPYAAEVYKRVRNQLHSSPTIKEFRNTRNMNVTTYNVEMTTKFFKKLDVLEIGELLFDNKRTVLRFLRDFITSTFYNFKILSFNVVLYDDGEDHMDMFYSVADQLGSFSSQILKWNSYVKKKKNAGVANIKVEIGDPDDPESVGRKELKFRYFRSCAWCGLTKYYTDANYHREKRRRRRRKKVNLRRCSRCLRVFYCSTKCQKCDWKGHKKNCNSIGKVTEKI